MFVPQTLNELAKLALIASDDSYFTAALAAPSTLGERKKVSGTIV